MLTSPLFSILVGTVLGFLSGLGTGGGSLLVLWLTLVMHMEPSTARVINLLFFLPSAIIATILHWHQRRITWKQVIPAAIAGCITAFAFSSIGQRINTESLKKLFGVLLVFIGFKELFYRPRKPK